MPMGKSKYLLRSMPTSEYHAGAKVPVGMEHLLKSEIEPDLGAFIKIFQDEFKKMKKGDKK